MEERCLSTLDVDVEESVSVDVKVCLRNGTILPLKSPTLLPELSTVASIKACSNEYFMASIEFIGPGEYCPYCNPDQFLDYRDLKLSDCNMTSTRIRTSSASVHNGFTRHHADVRYLRRCSRCPQATVLYVKRKEVEKNGRDGNILQNLEKDKSVDGNNCDLFLTDSPFFTYTFYNCSCSSANDTKIGYDCCWCLFPGFSFVLAA